MKKYILLSLLLSPVSVLAGQVDSQTMTTEFSSKEYLLQNNFKQINNLKIKVNEIDPDVTKFKNCENKNKLYLGSGVSQADLGGCVDIRKVIDSYTSKKPEFIGYVSNVKNGALVGSSESHNYNPSDKTKSWGRARADSLCVSNVEASTRAMTVDDIKYVYKDLQEGISTFTSSHTRIWVFDNYEGANEDISSYMPKYYMDLSSSPNSFNNSFNWTGSAGMYGTVLELISNGGSGYYMQLKPFQSSSADTLDSKKALIACVRN